MTTSETMTPSSDGNDNAQTLSLDEAANLDWNDPEEETVPAVEEPQSDEETVEADDEDGPDTDEEADESTDDDSEQDADAEGEEEPSSTPEPDDTATVTIDGTKLSIAELKKGYFREADYTRHKQTVAQKAKDLETLSNRVTASVEAVAEFLQSSIPKMPDPGLALTNPGQHYREKTLHDNAMAQVAALIEKANAPKDVLNKLTSEQRKELLDTENSKLIEAFSTTATPEGRKKFFEGTTSAAKELGYSDEEISGATDHRLFKLAHYAKIGLAAEAAKAKAKQKVVNVPPVAPNKRQPGAATRSVQKNRAAMNRLAQTGSLQDALAVDFD